MSEDTEGVDTSLVDWKATAETLQAALNARSPREPRVWFNGDDVPAGTFFYRIEHTGPPEDRIQMFDPYEDVANGNYGPLVEIVLPPDIEHIVKRAREERNR